MELSLSISDYFMLYSMMGENDSDETFTALRQSWKVRYFDGNGIKITVLNPNEDLFKKIIVQNINIPITVQYFLKKQGK